MSRVSTPPRRPLLARFAADTRGATAIEYALIGTLISVAIIGGALATGARLDAYWQALAAGV